MDAETAARLYREQMGPEAAQRQEALASAFKTRTCACDHLPGVKPDDGHKLGCPLGVVVGRYPKRA